MADKMVAYVAGEFVEADEATVPISNAALLQGIGVYETLRTYGGRPLRPDAHLERLRRGAAYLHLRLPKSDKGIALIVGNLLRTNRLEDARVRITATATSVEQLEDPGPSPAELIVTACPLSPAPRSIQKDGVIAIVAEARANELDPSAQHKTTSRARYATALRQAHAAGAFEAIFLNARGRVAEGTVSNVFVVRDSRLATPPASEGLLPGITRSIVMELAVQEDRTVEERPVEPAELLAAHEVFITNSILEIVPVIRIDGRAIGNGRPGPITRKFIEAYKTLVARET
jgi:branched-chain amino acid aminotransferase